MAFKTVWGTSAIAGAPSLTGQAGSLITLLDALLVNGYGSITLDSLAVSSGIATATYSSGHTFPQFLVVEIAGVTDLTGLNGKKRIATVSGTTFTFDATGISDGTASGTITAKVPGAGWTKAYTGTDLAAYRNNSTTGNGAYLRIDDTGTTDARAVGYLTMSNVDTGTDPFPSSTLVSGGGYYRKSATTDATARSWVFIGDDLLFYTSIFTTTSAYKIVAFGDFYSFSNGSKTYDSCLAISATSTGVAGMAYLDGNSSNQRVYIPRIFAGTGTAVHGVKNGLSDFSNVTAQAYPHPVSGGLLCSSAHHIHEGTGITANIRGKMPGYLQIGNNVAPSLSNGYVLPVTGLASPIILLYEGSGGSSNSVCIGVQLGDWR